MRNVVNVEFWDIIGQSANTPLTIGTTATDTDAINVIGEGEGIFQIHTDVACFIKIHATDASDVTVANGFPLNAGSAVPFLIKDGYKVGAITAAGTGTLRIHRGARNSAS